MENRRISDSMIARMDEKIDHICEGIAEIKKMSEFHDTRIRTVENWQNKKGTVISITFALYGLLISGISAGLIWNIFHR